MNPTIRPSREAAAVPAAARGWRPALTVLAGPCAALLGTLAFLYAVYGGVHMVFLRAESGGLLADVQHGWPSVRQRLHDYLTTSHNGHYTPLFFSFELLCTVLCTTHEAAWRLRQLTLLALLALAMMTLFAQTAGREADRTARWSLAAGLSALFLLTPDMVSMVGWPFQSGQLIWALFTVLSLAWLGRAAAQAAEGEVSARTLGASLAFAYVSLHILGLGLATLAGWFTGWAVLFLAGWRQGMPAHRLRLLGIIGLGGMVLTAAHLALMVLLLPPDTPIGAAGSISVPTTHPFSWHFATETLGYTITFLFGCVRSLWSPNSWLSPNVVMMSRDWPYGLGALVLLAAVGVGGWRAYRARPTAAGLRALCWYGFSLAAFVVFVLLVVVRMHQDNGNWTIYLVVERYVWPGAILLVGFAAAGASLARVRDRWTAVAIGGALLGGATLGNLVYQRQVLPDIWPWVQVSHEDAWRQIVAMTRELRQANLPIPDLGMGRLTGEADDAKLRWYSSLLRQQGGLSPNVTPLWREAGQISPEYWRAALAASPTLVKLEENVLGDPEGSTAMEVSSVARHACQRTPLFPLTAPEILASAELSHVKDQPNLGVPITVDGITKNSLWIDAPTVITFRNLPLSQHPSFITGVTIHPSIYTDDRADGAVFQVDVRAGGQVVRVGELSINPIADPLERCWMPLRVDLSRFAGQHVDLILSNDPGPAGNAYADWCIWGDPEIVEE